MKKLFGISVFVIGLVLGLTVTTKAFASCGGWFEPSCDDTGIQQMQEQNIVTDTINKLIQAVPVPQLKSSLERKNIKRRLETFSDESKVSYIYLISFGRVMAFYTIKGKITSGNKRLTSTERLVRCDGGEFGSDCIMESPELDGTYGSSSSYVFFWTTDGTYVQWNGEYMLADQPLKITTQPELVREIK